MLEKSRTKNQRLIMSNFKLNALLEITLAINENLPVETLLQKYEKILKEDLEIGKVVIFKKTETWDCILNSGFTRDLTEDPRIGEKLTNIRDISPVGVISENFSPDVDIIVPVIHKNEPIAYVLIGDIDEESEGVSPIIKHLRFIQTLSNIIIVAIENIRLYNENLRQVAIKRELELASKMQNMLIPEEKNLPVSSKIKFSTFYHPHYDVGGDYYDVVKLSASEIGFCIADVSGKGMSAAILMSNFQANLRALFIRGTNLKPLVAELNKRVMDSAKGEKFITLFLAKFNTRRNTLEYINAGHNPPLFYDVSRKKLNLLKTGTVGLGMLDELPFINSEEIRIRSNCKLLCYTDGLVELLEEEGVEYGTRFIEEKIRNSRTIDQNMKTIIEEQNILNGSTSIFDDISILGMDFITRA